MTTSTRKARLIADDIVSYLKGCVICGTGDPNHMDNEFGRAEGALAALRFLESRATAQEERDIYDKAITECQTFKPKTPEERAKVTAPWD